MKKIIFIHGGESFATEREYQNFLRDSYIPRQIVPWEDIEKPDWRKEILKNWTQQG